MAADLAPPTLDPQWLAHRYDEAQGAVHLLRVTRALRRAAPFLTDEHLADAGAPVVMPLAEAAAGAGAPGPVHFIFHSAYCCSTLLANAYDVPGLATSLKEPVILNDLVGWRHRGAAAEPLVAVADGALHLLARPFEPGEAVVIKPSNVVNGLADLLLHRQPGARALLLHAPLRRFVGSIADKGLWGRLWVRDLLLKQLRGGLLEGMGFDGEQLLLLSDLQAAALGWLVQQRLFGQLAQQWPERVRTLDSEVLLADPDAALRALDTHFGIARPAEARAEAIATVFTRHAKFGGAFDRADRAANQQSAAAVHGDEIDKVMVWAEAVAAHAGVPLALPAPLLQS